MGSFQLYKLPANVQKGLKESVARKREVSRMSNSFNWSLGPKNITLPEVKFEKLNSTFTKRSSRQNMMMKKKIVDDLIPPEEEDEYFT